MSLVENNQKPPAETSDPSGKSDDDHDCLSDLFVWREELQRLIDFATAPQDFHRLRTVAAPPGYGKTCLLRRLYQMLSNQSVRDFKELFVIRVPLDHFESFGDIEAWLLEVVAQAQGVCPDVEEIDSNTTSETMIGYLLQKLCEVCKPKWRIILIVDALDELPNHLRHEFENRVLEKFWRKDCVRIVISFRDDQRLENPSLRRGEKRITLSTFTLEQGREQLKKRAKIIPELLNTPFDVLCELVQPYPFNHPGLNTILARKIKQNEENGHNPVLTAGDLQKCWFELIKEPLAPDPGYAVMLEADLKKVIMVGEDSWTFETFASICEYSQKVAFDHWQDLMERSVVTPHRTHKSRYIIIDGLRELLCAELRLRGVI